MSTLSTSQKGNSLIFVLLGVLVIVLIGGAYYLGQQSSNNVSNLSNDMVVLPTSIPSQSTEVKVLVSPSPTSIPAKKLNYNLPSGWKTIQDPTGTFEIGYDPIKTVLQNSTSNPTGAGLYLYGNWQDNPAKKIGFNYDVALKPYDGGSRHIFILGSDYATNFEKASSYHEKTYTYNGWSCLVLYGTYVSQSFVTWGMCATSGTQAFAFSFDSENESEVEQIIQTIKLLK